MSMAGAAGVGIGLEFASVAAPQLGWGDWSDMLSDGYGIGASWLIWESCEDACEECPAQPNRFIVEPD